MLFPVLVLVLFVYVARDNINDWWLTLRTKPVFRPYGEDNVILLLSSPFFFTMGITIAFGVGLVISLVVGSLLPKELYLVREMTLTNLRETSGISGNFYLGTGTIGTEQYYFYYEEANGGYRPGKIQVAGNVTVFEEERKNGQIKVYANRFANPLFNVLVFHIPGYGYTIHVPKGSIKSGFTLG